MVQAWERLRHPPPRREEPVWTPPLLHGRTVGELEEMFQREVRELAEAELTELFGYLAPQVAQLNMTVGRALSWARSQCN